MLTRLAGADFQVHAQHQRFPGGGDQQAAHHLKRRGLSRAVRPEEAENLPAFDLKINVVGGGKIAEFLGQGLRLNHRVLMGAFHGVDNVAQRRFGSTGAAQQVDKGILEARRGFGDLQRRHIASLLYIADAGLFFKDQAYRFTLNHAIADLR